MADMISAKADCPLLLAVQYSQQHKRQEADTTIGPFLGVDPLGQGQPLCIHGVLHSYRSCCSADKRGLWCLVEAAQLSWVLLV
jgi:hypothetical protein